MAMAGSIMLSVTVGCGSVRDGGAGAPSPPPSVASPSAVASAHPGGGRGGAADPVPLEGGAPPNHGKIFQQVDTLKKDGGASGE